MTDALLFTTAGVLSEYMEGKPAWHVASMVAVLLCHRDKPDGAWSQGILDTMTKVGLIGANR